LCFDEGRRVVIDPEVDDLSFRISRYGVTRTSLGITIWLGQEGFPDMSRFSAAPRGAAGQVVLTRQGISLP